MKSEMSRLQARRAAKGIERSHAANPTAIDPRATPRLSQWLDTIIVETDAHLTPATIRLYDAAKVKLLDYFRADPLLTDITRNDTAQWVAWLGSTAFTNKFNRGGKPYRLSRFSIKRNVVVARTLFQHAADRDLIPFNPFDRVKLPSVEVREFPIVPVEVVLRVAHHASPQVARMLLLARMAGLRRGEMVRLDWADVDTKARTIAIRPVGGLHTTKQRHRVVPITPALWSEMEGWGDRVGPVCPGSIHGLEESIRAAIKDAGVVAWPKPLHTLRKNCETDWLGQFPALDVVKWLGNSVQVAIKHYHKVDDKALRRATCG